MQLVKTQRDALLRPLQTVSGIVERRHTMPILANILIQKSGDRVTFLSTDMEIQITTEAIIGSGEEDVSTTVAARKFLDILRALPDDNEVTLLLANKKLTIQSKKSRFNLQTLPAEDFPLLKQPESYPFRIVLSNKSLKHLIGMVHFSMAQQDIRYYLNGLLLIMEGKCLMGVATDGHRLAYCSVDDGLVGGESTERQEVIVPRKTVLELQRLLDDSDEPVTIEIGANQVCFTLKNVTLVSKLVEGKFPDYQRVIPTGYTRTFLIPREALLQSLQRVAILTSEKFKGVRCILADDVVKISSTNADQEDAQDEIQIEYAHDALDIGFNVSYLLDVLNNLKTENIQVSLGDANSSALFTVPGNESFKYVVMPMRI